MLSIKEVTSLNAAGFSLENGFEANGLSAELNLVGTVFFGSPAFVFNGDNGAVFVDFDDIANALECVLVGPNLEASGDSDAGSGFALTGVSFFMENPTRSGRVVFRPNLFDMNQRTLPRAVEVML